MAKGVGVMIYANVRVEERLSASVLRPPRWWRCTCWIKRRRARTEKKLRTFGQGERARPSWVWTWTRLNSGRPWDGTYSSRWDDGPWRDDDGWRDARYTCRYKYYTVVARRKGLWPPRPWGGTCGDYTGKEDERRTRWSIPAKTLF